MAESTAHSPIATLGRSTVTKLRCVGALAAILTDAARYYDTSYLEAAGIK
jgi:hypothetical protein